MMTFFLSRLRWRNFGQVLFGDINSDFDLTTDKDNVSKCRNLLRQFNLIYVNFKPTRGLASLDNVFTNVRVT